VKINQLVEKFIPFLIAKNQFFFRLSLFCYIPDVFQKPFKVFSRSEVVDLLDDLLLLHIGESGNLLTDKLEKLPNLAE